MAGDWIKVEKVTAQKPEVLQIAELLSIHPDHAFGLCVRFWCWCDDQMVDGNAPRVTSVTLDRVFGQQGFTDSLLKVGWLRVRSGSLEIPNFDRHLSQGSKNRALAAERVSQHRKKNSNGSSVTKALPEKRRVREELKTKDKEPPAPLPGGMVSGSDPPKASTEKPPPKKPFDPRTAEIPPTLDTQAFREAWQRYCLHREQLPKAKPQTSIGVETLLKKLAKLGPSEAIERIDLAIANGWTGVVFPSENNGKPKGPPHGRTRPPEPESVSYDPSRPDFRPEF